MVNVGKKTVRQDVMINNGTAYPVIVTKITGRNIYDTPEGNTEADEYQEIDWGPKLGVTRTYGHRKEVTPDEAAANRQSIERLLGGLRRDLAMMKGRLE